MCGGSSQLQSPRGGHRPLWDMGAGAATWPSAVTGDTSLAPGTPGSPWVPWEGQSHLVQRHLSPQRSLHSFHCLQLGCPGASPMWCHPPPLGRLMDSSKDELQPSRAGQGARGGWGDPAQGSSALVAPRQPCQSRGRELCQARHQHGSVPASQPRGTGTKNPRRVGVAGTGTGWSGNPVMGKAPASPRRCCRAGVRIGVGQASSAMAGDRSLVMQGGD